MLGGLRTVRNGVAALAAMAMMGLAAPCQAQTTGSVHFVVGSAGFIVGVGGGSGTLIFHGHRYPLSVSGIGVGATIGAAKTELVGRALNLRQAQDIEGVYSAAGAGAAVAGGGGAIRLQNSRGVVLDLRGRKVGLQLSAAVSGVEIRIR